MKIRDLIKRSLRLIGASATGESVTADEMADAVFALRGMLANWSINNLLGTSVVREEFDLIPGQQKYTLGPDPTADFETSRPVAIVSAALLNEASTNYESRIELRTAAQWAAIKSKGVTSSMPNFIYIEGASPLEKINVWPVPNEAKKLVLYSTKILSDVMGPNDEVNFPPGYEQALAYNLAIILAPEFGRSVTPEVAAIASTSLGDIKRKNISPAYLTSDAFSITGRTSFDIFTGE